jgi:hypothetical protein
MHNRTSDRRFNRLFIQALLSACLILVSCASPLFIKPSIPSKSSLGGVADELAIFISPIYQRQVFTRTTSSGGDIEIQIGQPFIDMSREALSPLFKRVLVLGNGESSPCPYHAEMRMDRFEVNEQMEAQLTIWCKLTLRGKTLLEANFAGNGIRTDGGGFLKASRMREEAAKSSEAAFREAFLKLQAAVQTALAKK